MGLDVYKLQIVNPAQSQIDDAEDGHISGYFLFDDLEIGINYTENYKEFFKRFDKSSKKFLQTKLIDYDRYKKEFKSETCEYEYSGKYEYAHDKIQNLIKESREVIIHGRPTEDNSDYVVIFSLDNHLVITYDCYKYSKHCKGCYAKEVGYQRKGHNESLYTKFIGNCWYAYEDGSLNDKQCKIFIFKEDLKELKTCFDKDSPIQKWTLNEDEFIYLSA